MIEEAVKVLKNGGIVLYPTDTLYALGVDSQNQEAINKLVDIKGRADNNPIPVMVSDIDMARKYVEVSDIAKKIINKFLPGRIMLILPKIGGVEMGVRIPNNKIALDLVKAYGSPITVTSANLSGKKTGASVEEILKDIKVDYVIDGGVLENKASTIVNLMEGEVQIQREGEITKEQILSCLE